MVVAFLQAQTNAGSRLESMQSDPTQKCCGFGANEGLQSWTTSRRAEPLGGLMQAWLHDILLTMCCRPSHAVHFAVYEAAKKGLGEASGASFGGAALSGAAAVVISDACMTPFDVIKQRLQARAGA